MTALARASGAALALLATAGLVALSGVTLPMDPSPHGIIRLSWRAVGERVEECRVPTAEEQAALPLHMRRSEICEGRLAPFGLSVRLDGEAVVAREVRPAGAREDRPTYVYEEVRTAPGKHRLEVEFSVTGDARPGGSPPLRLDATVEVPPRGIVLVTRDVESGRLVAVDRVAEPGAVP